MIETNKAHIRHLVAQLRQERQLTRAIINAAQDLKAVAGDPSPFLLEAARKLESAIAAYYQETLRDQQ